MKDTIYHPGHIQAITDAACGCGPFNWLQTKDEETAWIWTCGSQECQGHTGALLIKPSHWLYVSASRTVCHFC